MYYSSTDFLSMANCKQKLLNKKIQTKKKRVEWNIEQNILNVKFIKSDLCIENQILIFLHGIVAEA